MTNIDQLFEQWYRTQDWFRKERLHILDQSDCESFARFVLESLAPSKHSELNAFLLVNFLRLPPEHKAHLVRSIMEKGGGEYLWKPYPENKPTKENAFCVIRTADEMQMSSLYMEGDELWEKHVVAFMEIPEFKSTKS